MLYYIHKTPSPLGVLKGGVGLRLYVALTICTLPLVTSRPPFLCSVYSTGRIETSYYNMHSIVRYCIYKRHEVI